MKLQTLSLLLTTGLAFAWPGVAQAVTLVLQDQLVLSAELDQRCDPACNDAFRTAEIEAQGGYRCALSISLDASTPKASRVVRKTSDPNKYVYVGKNPVELVWFWTPGGASFVMRPTIGDSLEVECYRAGSGLPIPSQQKAEEILFSIRSPLMRFLRD